MSKKRKEMRIKFQIFWTWNNGAEDPQFRNSGEMVWDCVARRCSQPSLWKWFSFPVEERVAREANQRFWKLLLAIDNGSKPEGRHSIIRTDGGEEELWIVLDIEVKNYLNVQEERRQCLGLAKLLKERPDIGIDYYLELGKVPDRALHLFIAEMERLGEFSLNEREYREVKDDPLNWKAIFARWEADTRWERRQICPDIRERIGYAKRQDYIIQRMIVILLAVAEAKENLLSLLRWRGENLKGLRRIQEQWEEMIFT